MRTPYYSPYYAAILFSGFLSTAISTSVQTVPHHTLATRLGRAVEGHSDITGVRELPDGRVLGVDFRENLIIIFDFARGGTEKLVSRDGDGPTEYRVAVSLIPWVGDTTLIMARSGSLKITPSGQPVAGYGPIISMATGWRLSSARFSDRAGLLYHEAAEPLKPNADGVSFVPSIAGAVVRRDPRTGETVDTVARMMHRDPKQPLVRPWRPYPAKDAVGVFSDGSVAVVRAQDYRVEVWKNDKLVIAGPRINVERIPITSAERDAFRDGWASRPAGGGGSMQPSGPVTEADRAAARRALNLPDEAFPPFLPPFVEPRGALVDLNDRLWVARSFRARDTDRLYDVFDNKGNLLRRVTLKNRGQIVGFGKGVLYVVTPDADDVQWLEKYAMP